MKQIRWLRLVILLLAIIAISFGFAYLLQNIVSPLQMTVDKFAWLAYLSVFGTTLLGSLTIIAPVPIAAAIMITVATRWNPILVAFFASIGGTLGELSGYYAGYVGTKIATGEYIEEYNRITAWMRITGWMNRHGFWAIAFLAFQPILPVDVAGLIAGASKMPLRKFLPSLWMGKFPKFIILCYLGARLIHLLPFS